MRHFLGLLLGVVVTGILLAGTGWASQDAARGVVNGAAAAVDPVRDTTALIGLGAMLAAGLVLGLVVAGRVSPLATFIPSMALLAWTVVYLLDVHRALGLVPADPSMSPEIVQAGKGMQNLLAEGVYAMIGIALFIPVLMPSRWAGRQRDMEEGYDEESSPSGSYY
ncbi:hypothetical protein ACFFWE_04895 [Sphaerisporangium melleum]|uniref:hypothetical protein n=1 Tax=Sphaerisporangium melleum TaxID=321316 RepID=UPI00166C6015|nr:hypothetical protein [Sphaerisporangium melleum]